MGRKPTKPSPQVPSFFKVLVADDFCQHMPLAPSFTNKFTRRPPCKCALRGPSGKWWKVGLEEREDGLLLFREGWQRFVNDHSLEIGEFLVFDYDGGSKFDVTIYEPTGCEKEIQVAKRNSENQARVKHENIEPDTEDSEENNEEEARISYRRKGDSVSGKRRATEYVRRTSEGLPIVFPSENPCFVGTLTKNQYRMNIPKQLAVAVGLIRKKRVKLKDPNGRSWTVKLRLDEKKHFGGRLLMTEGFLSCCRKNKISREDTMVFELVNAKRGIMKMHIFRAAPGGRKLSVVTEPSGVKIRT